MGIGAEEARCGQKYLSGSSRLRAQIDKLITRHTHDHETHTVSPPHKTELGAWLESGRGPMPPTKLQLDVELRSRDLDARCVRPAIRPRWHTAVAPPARRRQPRAMPGESPGRAHLRLCGSPLPLARRPAQVGRGDLARAERARQPHLEQRVRAAGTRDGVPAPGGPNGMGNLGPAPQVPPHPYLGPHAPLRPSGQPRASGWAPSGHGWPCGAHG